jgi:hypothetical protein
MARLLQALAGHERPPLANREISLYRSRNRQEDVLEAVLHDRRHGLANPEHAMLCTGTHSPYPSFDTAQAVHWRVLTLSANGQKQRMIMYGSAEILNLPPIN